MCVCIRYRCVHACMHACMHACVQYLQVEPSELQKDWKDLALSSGETLPGDPKPYCFRGYKPGT